jgi:hypothetical protein
MDPKRSEHARATPRTPTPGTLPSRARATSFTRSSDLVKCVPLEPVTLDPVEEALLELARSALRNRREVAERRGKMTPVEGGKRGGRTA